MATYNFTGQFNSYIAKANGQVIANARDPKKYRVNKYTRAIKVEEALFVYYYIHPDDFVRTPATKSSVWYDGQERPEISGQRIRHKTREGQCIRYFEDFQIGWETLKRADYNVLLGNTRAVENKVMIDWTNEVITLGEDPTQWSGNTADASDLAGGAPWDTGTPEHPTIKMSLLEIAERITLNTNGIAGDFENEDDVKLKIVLGVGAARKMATTPEIHAVYKESTFAERLVGKLAANPNAIYGLPKMLYGFEVVVETAIQVTENPQLDGDLALTTGSPAPRRFCKDSNSAIIVSNNGSVDGEIGAPNYETFQRFYKDQEILLETEDQSWHKRTRGGATRHGTTHLVAPATGFLVTNILTPS